SSSSEDPYRGTVPPTAHTPCAPPPRYLCGSRRSSCDLARDGPKATSLRDCVRPLVQAVGSTAPGSDSRKCTASGEPKDDTPAGPWPPDRPLQRPSRLNRARQQKRRSHEPDCPR